MYVCIYVIARGVRGGGLMAVCIKVHESRQRKVSAMLLVWCMPTPLLGTRAMTLSAGNTDWPNPQTSSKAQAWATQWLSDAKGLLTM